MKSSNLNEGDIIELVYRERFSDSSAKRGVLYYFRSADERKIQVSKQKILYNERLSYWETHSIPLSMLEDIIKYELK